MQNKLAIAIPTYNRAEMLEYNLLQIIDELRHFQIPVYISDDSTNDETEKCIRKLNRIYGLFHYKKNEIRLGHDLNCLRTISLAVEDYVWYMGDSMIIKPGAIPKVLSCVATDDHDFISCNAEGRTLDIDSRVFDNGTMLLETLCWHLTMTGSTIYSRKVITTLSHFDVAKYKNFPQTAIVFEYFAAQKAQLFWINDKLIYGNPKKNSYWVSKVFEVFVDDFRSFLYHLPEYYSMKSKNKVLLQHAICSGIFSYRSFVLYRMEGFYNYTIFKKYKNDFKTFTRTNLLFLFFLSFIWVQPLKKFRLFLKRTI